MSASAKRNPAPRANAGDRALCSTSQISNSTWDSGAEDLAERFVARRYRLTPRLARVVITLAGIARGFA
jgi:hypothetical protein